MAVCPRCGTLADPGALFCKKCGATVLDASGAERSAPIPPAPAPAPAPPPAVPGPFIPPPVVGATPAPPPPDWIPAPWIGRAVHCVGCNTLISAVAVRCPVCGAAQPARGGAAAVAAPPR